MTRYPKGPDGQKRPAVVGGLAVPIGKMAAGAIEDERIFQEIMAISKRSSKLPRRWASMAEFDAAEYDERGNCR
jgi:hypothetical protein